MGKEVENDQREAWEWGLLPRPGATKGGSGVEHYAVVPIWALSEDVTDPVAAIVPDN